jgi:hypothetical protein
MKWWADWLADNSRDHARYPGLTLHLLVVSHFEMQMFGVIRRGLVMPVSEAQEVVTSRFTYYGNGKMTKHTNEPL